MPADTHNSIRTRLFLWNDRYIIYHADRCQPLLRLDAVSFTDATDYVMDFERAAKLAVTLAMRPHTSHRRISTVGVEFPEGNVGSWIEFEHSRYDANDDPEEAGMLRVTKSNDAKDQYLSCRLTEGVLQRLLVREADTALHGPWGRGVARARVRAVVRDGTVVVYGTMSTDEPLRELALPPSPFELVAGMIAYYVPTRLWLRHTPSAPAYCPSADERWLQLEFDTNGGRDLLVVTASGTPMAQIPRRMLAPSGILEHILRYAKDTLTPSSQG